MTRIPHPSVETEVRQAFQRLTLQTDVITTGAVGYVLVGAGVGAAPTWTTDLTALTSLTVDNISINAAVITSDTGAISFDNENLTTSGTIAGVNVTSGADPGHTHTGASLGSIDISDDTNLAVTAPIVLTDDTLSLDYEATDFSVVGTTLIVTDSGVDHNATTNTHNLTTDIDHDVITNTHNLTTDVDHGAIGGLGDDDHTIYLLASGVRALTGNMAVDAAITIDGRDISVDGMALDSCVAIQGMVGIDISATPGYLGAANSDGVLRTSTGISYADGGNFVTLTTNDGEIIHDNLSGYDANKHIDHTAVSVSAGTGLTGGGTIAATRTLSLSHLGIQSLTDPGADRIMFWDDVGASAVTWLVVSTGLQITTTNLTTKDSEIVHDNLSGYDANKHVDHTGVTLTAGSGIAGGGDISASRTFDLDINSLAAAAIAAGDFVPFWDITATATNKKITFANFEAAVNHDVLTNHIAAQHIDWTGATDNFSTTGTGKFTLDATDVIGFELDGQTTPFTTAATSCWAMQLKRYVNYGTGNLGDVTGLQAKVEVTHTDAVTTGTHYLRSYLQWVTNNASFSNDAAATHTYITYGIEGNLTDTSSYDTSAAGRILVYQYGNRVTATTLTPTFTDSGGSATDAAIFSVTGLSVKITSAPVLTSGTLNNYIYGANYNIEGTTTGTSRAYGIYVTAAKGCDRNHGIYIVDVSGGTRAYGIYIAGPISGSSITYGIWDASGANWALDADSQKILFGEGQNASICQDGTDFIFDAQEVGTGHIILKSFKTDTGDPATVEGKFVINTFDNNIQVYADGAWRELASW